MKKFFLSLFLVIALPLMANAADYPGTATGAELDYVHGVTSAIQAQLNARQLILSEGAFVNGDKTALDLLVTRVDQDVTSGAAPTFLGTNFTAIPIAGLAVDIATQAELDTHTGDTSNPHSVTAAQAGAEPAMTAASQAEMEAGTESAIRKMSPLRVAQAIAALASGADEIVYLSDCSGISNGFCIDTDDQYLYYYDGTQVMQVYPASGTDSSAIHVGTSGEINGISQKGSALVDGDQLVGEAVSTNAKIKILLSEVLTYITSNITSMDLKLDASTASGHPLYNDDSYSGMPLTGINAGETIAQWALVYYDTTQTEWMIADQSAVGTRAWGIAVAAGMDGNALDVLQKGWVRDDGSTWTPGAILYLGASGALTETAPTTTQYCLQPVGIAYTSHIAWIDINPVTGYARMQ